MKIEFLESGSDDCPLIRIFGNEPNICEQMRIALVHLSLGNVSEVVLTQLPGIQSIGDCCLIANSGDRDVGVIRNQANVFCWELTAAAWEDVALLLEPFCGTHDDEYQWLNRLGEIQVLVSTTGYW